jgi:hypothetical protein
MDTQKMAEVENLIRDAKKSGLINYSEYQSGIDRLGTTKEQKAGAFERGKRAHLEAAAAGQPLRSGFALP